MKKVSGGPKFRDFSKYMMNFQKIKKKKLGFSQCFGLIQKVQVIRPPSHSGNIQKSRPIRVKYMPYSFECPGDFRWL